MNNNIAIVVVQEFAYVRKMSLNMQIPNVQCEDSYKNVVCLIGININIKK